MNFAGGHPQNATSSSLMSSRSAHVHRCESLGTTTNTQYVSSMSSSSMDFASFKNTLRMFKARFYAIVFEPRTNSEKPRTNVMPFDQLQNYVLNLASFLQNYIRHRNPKPVTCRTNDCNRRSTLANSRRNKLSFLSSFNCNVALQIENLLKRRYLPWDVG